MSADHDKAVPLRELDYRPVILLGRAEARGEFRRSEKFVEVGARRIINSQKQLGEDFAVAQWQADSQIQALYPWETPCRGKTGHGSGHMAGQYLCFRSADGRRR